MRDLDLKIQEWRSRMAAGGINTPAVLEELESHLREEIERQVRFGIDEGKAFEFATQKIGGSDLLRAEFAKIARFNGIPVGRVVGIACCVTAALYSMLLAPHLATISEPGSAQTILGLGAVFLTLLFLVSLRFSYKFLPVIRNRRARVASVGACAVAAFVSVFVFSNLLPDLVVPRWMARTFTETEAARPRSGGYGSESLMVHNTVSPGGENLIVQPGYIAKFHRQWQQSRPSTTLRPVFNIGILWFWAMTLAAALGGLAYGLDEAARRRATGHVYV